MEFSRPSRRDDFEIAIICALPIEYDAVALLFDERWDKNGDTFGKAPGDANIYISGRIGKHHVVTTLLPGMGKAKAAAAAASIKSSYRTLQLVLLIGICGGVPSSDHGEIHLGDVVISKEVIQHDFARKYPDKLIRKDSVDDNLSKPVKSIRNLLAWLSTEDARDSLEQRTMHFLDQLPSNVKYQYPGIAEDKLFESSYRHKHRNSSEMCICSSCHGRLDPVCEAALNSSCDRLGCDERYLKPRAGTQTPRSTVHLGKIASGDTVMKSAEDRDSIAEATGAIAFEMEAAGVWEELPCIVVKGVCDYADCHKNKKWQGFAAIIAASTSKAILEQLPRSNDRRLQQTKDEPGGSRILLPFGRNSSFVGREAILSQLVGRIWPGQSQDDCQRTVIEGLGGVGKTQIALEAVYQIRKRYPDCSVFWVPALNETSFQNAYRDIGRLLGIKSVDDQGTVNVQQLVKAALSAEKSSSWLLVIDNADDDELLFGENGLVQSLPFHQNGSILFTTRTREVAVRLTAYTEDAVIPVVEMDKSEALELLRGGLKESQTSDIGETQKLLDFLANLPLALKQASAYMARTQISTSEYLKLCESEHQYMINLLSRNFDDPHRYKETLNPVATTWFVSFQHISKQNTLAIEYLRFMSLLAEKDIPKSLLPIAGTLETIEAISSLKSYGFITQRVGKESFDMHRLVRLATQNWLDIEGQLADQTDLSIQRLDQSIPLPRYENRDEWIGCISHMQTLLRFRKRFISGKSDAELGFKLAQGYALLGQYQLAEEMYRLTLGLRQKVYGKEHPSTFDSMNNLAIVLRRLGRYEEAEGINRLTLGLREKVLGKQHPSTLSSIDNLAIVLENLGRHKEAEEMHRLTLGLTENVLGKEHPSTLNSMNNLAVLLKGLGRYKEAEEMHRQELSLCEKVHGKEHPSTLNSMNNLAVVLKRLRRCEEAEGIHRLTLGLREKVLGQQHPSTLDSMNNLAITLKGLGRYKEAEEMHRLTLALREKVLGKQHSSTLGSINNLARMLRKLGRYEEAEETLSKKST